jgi:two-component system sensor histidine kinase UhpB
LSTDRPERGPGGEQMDREWPGATAAWFRAVYEQSPIAIELYDSDGALLDVNPACLALFGVEDRAELKGFRLFDDPNIPETQKAELRAGRAISYDVAFDFGLVRSLNLYTSRRCGQVNLHVQAAPLYLSHGHLAGYVVHVNDVTASSRARKELAQSAERFRAVFENAPDAFYIMDLEGHFLDVNRASQEMVGLSREELVGRTFLEAGIIPADGAEKTLKLMEQVRRGAPTAPDEVRLIRSSGGMVDVEVRSFPLELGGRHVWLGIARDITDRKSVESALRESEEQYRSLFEQSLDAIFINLPNGTSVDANQAWLDLFGYTREDLKTLRVTDVYADANDRAEFLRKMEQDGRVEDDVRFKRKDGSILLCHRAVVARRDEYGRVTAFQGIVRDVTEQRAREEALRTSEEEYRRIFEQSRDSIHIASVDGRILRVNEAATELFGYSREELLSMHVKDLYANPEEREKVVRRARRKNGLRNFELVLRRKDGEVRDSLVTTTVLKDASGKVLGFQSFIRDVTDRRRAEKALEESELRFRTLVDSTGTGVLLVSQQGQVVDFNSAMLRLTAYDAAELRGLDVARLYVHPEDRNRVRNALLANGSVRAEVEFLRHDGHAFYANLVSAIVPLNGSDVFMSQVTDISERKEMELRLENSYEELKRLAARLEVAREEERAAVAWELHDEVAQALSAIKMDLDLCSRRLPGDVLAAVQPTLDGLQTLLDATIARLRHLYADLVPVMLEDLGLAAAVDWWLQAFQERSGITAVAGSMEDVRSLGDRPALIMYRVLQEALENVARHSGAGVVVVDLKTEKDHIVLRVADDGAGLPPEGLARSSGLGIASMRERMRSIGGELRIRSGEPGGTILEAILPVGHVAHGGAA